MKEQPKFKIVYVFGPMQCLKKYNNDETLTHEANEWVKIGETQYNGDIDDKRAKFLDAAMNRIKGESKTGIPFVSKIFDVFIFPFRPIKTDDLLRKRLCNELFEIENSKQHNQKLKETEDPYMIKAGQEFVYNIKRSRIKYAVQSIDHDLIVEAVQKKDDQEIELMAKICQCNDIDIDNTITENDDAPLTTRKPRLNLNLIFYGENDQYNCEKNEFIVFLTDGSGNKVKDENGDEITARYMGDNMFECRGELGRSSPLAQKYLNMYAGKNMQTVNGNEYWTYRDQKLTSYRKN